MTTSDHASVSGPVARAPGRRERLSSVVRGFLAGNQDDLDALVTELTPLLWRVARSTGLDAASCEDVVQQSWLTLLNHRDQIRTPDALVGWLATVTRREAVRVFTAQGRVRPAPDDLWEPVPDSGPAIEDMLVSDERRRALWRVVRRLPHRCVQLLQVIAFSERPDYAGIAAALGMPKGSIGPTRGRCLAKLREMLLAESDWSWR
ncbi:RNA polymerase sigma factor, sigma-70 family [Asanoa hainanensis]|uniref:RNA polymerase sigma factor, sigma-70 family n=1 Tax=Asanoa hainanensis TaxID=560556 RepID=A0A239NFP0_9ACTN|nr:sigma-70 family RNA polymerase sigma factor [Asanoa hainanensis]SNT53777.1 RNA polymerase sigma factor, sigma-70 family [Asanoa hainanensis]